MQVPNAYLHIDCTLISWGKTYGHAESQKETVGGKTFVHFFRKNTEFQPGFEIGMEE